MDVVERWGRLFKRTEYGLDDKQLASFIEELIRERDMLVKQQEHLFSLIRLAEKASGSDNIVRGVYGEAPGGAKGQTRQIMSRQIMSRQIMGERKAEAATPVGREVEAVKANAQRQVDLLLQEKGKAISPQLRESVYRLHDELQAQLENLKQQIVTLEEEFEGKLSQLAEETSAVVGEAEEEKLHSEFRELVETADPSKAGEPEPDWEVQILPPIDLMQALAIMSSLDNLPEIEKTELIPDINKPTIAVFVRKQINLIDALRKLPQVAEVKEVSGSKAGSKPRKVQIVLAEKAISEKG